MSDKISSPPPLYFLHVGKTAGTSVRSLLDNAFDQRDIWPWYFANDIEKIRPDTQEPYLLYRGHTGLALIEKIRTTPEIITWLRDPVDLQLSVFYFRQQCREIPKTMRLKEWLEVYSGNHLFKSFYTSPPYTFGPDQIPALVKNLKQTLNSCKVIGLVEEQEKSLQLLCHRLRLLPPEKTPRLNPTLRRESKEQLNQSDLQLLTSTNLVDQEIYDYGKSVFTRLCRDMDETLAPGLPSLSNAERHRLLTETFWANYHEPWQEEIHYTFDRKLLGSGWFDRERAPESPGTTFRWISSHPEAYIWLPLHRHRTLILHIHVYQVIDEEIGRSLSLWIGDQSIPLSPSPLPSTVPGGFCLQGRLPADLSVAMDKPSCLRFRISGSRRPIDRDTHSTDYRSLGVAFHAIAAHPA